MFGQYGIDYPDDDLDLADAVGVLAAPLEGAIALLDWHSYLPQLAKAHKLCTGVSNKSGYAMGLEARCQCDWQGESGTVKVHLDSTGLDVRGSYKLHIDLKKIKAAEPGRGTLRLRTEDGLMVLHLGEKADAWAQFIKYPRSRIEKLGIKPGQRVLLVGLDDEALEADLASLECKVSRRETKTPVDVAMVLVDTQVKLQLIARYREAITPDGTVWVIRPKGKDTPVTEAQTRDAAKRAALVDVKVVSFSATHSAEKLVIPKAKRGA